MMRERINEMRLQVLEATVESLLTKIKLQELDINYLEREIDKLKLKQL